ncbi:hypothetical protein FDV58_13690 [Bradyrhizobium elkanii]|uniref:Uncharacterized protein n=1 Tax=Bradyrhizobium elkanii TaxID=29448 RepID=A0A4U6S8Z9_BRAEL|nr:hypothetical protein [Bradyrhizobium sp. BR2003]TKV81176.1 hypothetical protein FDV58_13690 [Bradyrhizobium elkanii]
MIQSKDFRRDDIQFQTTAQIGVAGMTSETAKAILMILLFVSLSTAIHLSERSATKRLRAFALQTLRRTHRR